MLARYLNRHVDIEHQTIFLADEAHITRIIFSKLKPKEITR